MSIIRREKTDNYSIIHNECFRNDRLSARAKGLFAYLMSLPDDWKIYKSELQNHFTEGRDAINTAFRELEEFGYVDKEPVQEENGQLSGWNYTIYESSELLENRITENPSDGKPATTNNLSKPNTDHTNSEKCGGGSSQKKDPSSEALSLSEALFLSIERFKPDYKHIQDKERALQSYAADIDRMLSIDKRKPERIRQVIDWLECNDKDAMFWRQNILSAKKLRQQFDTLEIRMDGSRVTTNHNRVSSSQKEEDYML